MSDIEYREALRKDMRRVIRVKCTHAKRGFIYFARILSGESQGDVKVGLSSNPQKRVKDQGFQLEQLVEVENMAEAETLIHMWLRNYSAGYGGEVFHMSPEHVIRAAHTVCLLTEDIALDGDE